MRAGRRPTPVLICCLVCALVGLLVAAPTRALAVGNLVVLNSTNFPDAEFRALMGDPAYDWNQDGYLNESEVANITQLDLTDTTISDVTGVNLLTSVEYLRIGGNMDVAALVVDGMPQLKTVNCDDCFTLKTFSAKNCPALQGINVRNCSLQCLDLSGCPSMQNLFAPGNKLAFLALPSGMDREGVDVSGQEDIRLYCASGDGGAFRIRLSVLAAQVGFEKFDPAKVTAWNFADGWTYDGTTGVFSISDAATASSKGLTYIYDDCLGVRARILTTPVSYSWTGAPKGVTPPVDPRGYASVEDAQASVETSFYPGYAVRVTSGIYTFSGWNVPYDVNEHGVLEVTGSWYFSPSFVNGWSRIFGDNAYDTMKACVMTGDVFMTGRGGTAIVATGDGYWDALAASGLAGCEYAPIITTPTGRLGEQAADQLRRLSPEKIIVMGGTFAVSDATYQQIQQTCPDAEVSRVFGDKADDTAVAAYKAGAAWGDTCVVATVNGYWDALSIAPYAYANNAPIFLTNGATNKLSNATVSAIRQGGFRHVVIVGGTGVVPDSVRGQLAGFEITRLAGENAIDTSREIALWEVNDQGMSTNHMAVATGGGYWDALAGAPLVGAQNSVLVLTNPGQTQAIDAVYTPGVSRVDSAYVLGGEMAVPISTWNYVSGSHG